MAMAPAKWPWPARAMQAAYAVVGMELTRRESSPPLPCPRSRRVPRPSSEVPYVPTPPELVQKMLDLAGSSRRDYLIDLGCGDGRIAVAAARRGARALGVDSIRARIAEAVGAARFAGVEDPRPLPPPGPLPHPDLRGERDRALSARRGSTSRSARAC